MIDIRGLTWRFDGAPRPALQEITLRIEPGELVVISGPSGCGKSTLALAMGGYLFQQYHGQAEGSVEVGGLDVRQVPIYRAAEIVGLVQQNPENQFCTLNVMDELAFALENRRYPPAEIRQQIAWALEVVGAAHLRDRALATLSGGEKQKVAIASMLVGRPQVLILDEPTSSLDPAATRAVLEAIGRLRQEAGLTVVIIEHKTAYLEPLRPRRILMREGRIVPGGGAAALRAEVAWPPARPPAARAPGAEPLVRVEGLSFAHGEAPVLREVSLAVYPGELVAVMGRNGSGKTTLLRCLLGLAKPTAGAVRVAGRDVRRTPVSTLARDVGLIFQNPDHQIFADSVWAEAVFAPNNLGLADGADARAEALLADYGLLPYRDQHPYRLSYGEKRRLNLAAVLSYAPPVLLLDEVLVGQDPANAAFLLGQLTQLAAAGRAIVHVTHDPLTTLRYADRLVFLDDGRVIVDDAPEAAFARLEATGYQPYLPLYDLPAGEG